MKYRKTLKIECLQIEREHNARDKNCPVHKGEEGRARKDNQYHGATVSLEMEATQMEQDESDRQRDNEGTAGTTAVKSDIKSS